MVKKVKLKDIATYINGKAFKPTEWQDSGLPIVRIQNLTGENKAFNYFDGEIDDKYILNNGDLLISWSATLDIYDWNRGEAVLNQHIFKVLFNKNIGIDKNFFKLAIKNILHHLEKFAHGSTMKHIIKKDFDNFEINLPTFEKQKQIAKTLDKANELIELRKESITKLDALAKSIFIDMFGDPVSNPKKWEIKKLKQLTDVKTGKTPSRAEPLYWEGGTELWATTTEVNKRFIFDTQEKVTKYAVEKCNLTVYPENTILIAMYGQGKTRGNVVLLKTKSTINQAFGAILSSENINQEFLLSLLKNSYSHIRSLGRGGNQENLNLDIVKNLDIINPSIALQNKFAKIIEKIEEQKSLYTQELEKLQENFDALLQKSFQ